MISKSTNLVMEGDQVEIKHYAPVIIPTLCRHDHFKACLESLRKCTHANKTEVYIGLDYPLKESHWEGYNKIVAYLDSIKSDHGFKKLHIIKREKNYGVGSNGNARSLRDYILSRFDNYIFSEDDNIFAPAFLDYCNKGLEKYRNDESIIAICGYRNYYNFKFANNTIARQGMDFVAWGYATWKDRIDSYVILSPQWFRHQFSIKRFVSFRRTNGNYRALGWLQHCFRPHRDFSVYDDTLSVMMGLVNKFTIMPSVSLVKNIGADGSGWHFQDKRTELDHILKNQEIFSGETYDFIGPDTNYYEENMKINKEECYNKISNTRFPIEIFKMFWSKLMTWYSSFKKNRKCVNV